MLIELIKRYFKSGVMENGIVIRTKEGSQQGDYTLTSIMELLGLKSKETIRRHYIYPALKLNLI